MLARKSLHDSPSNFDLTSSISRTIRERILIFLSVTSPSKSFSTALGRGPWDFRFCGFGSLWIGFSILVFLCCGFSKFQHLVSVFVRILMDFRIWYSMWCLFIIFGFRFLFDLSAGNDAPPLISSTRKTFVCPTCIGLIRVLITGM